MTPSVFLDLLWRDKPAAFYILIWVLRGKKSHWFRKTNAAADFISKRAGHDVYVGVGLSERDRGSDHRCGSDEVAGLAGFWADFDLRSEAHPKNSLPTTIEEAVSIIPTEFAPTVLVLTGNGLHAWWLFKEPWIFESEAERRKAAALSSRWQTLMKYNAAQQGWALERLADLARVLRIPGTVNAKDPQNPKPVTVHSISDRRYNPPDFVKHLDDLGVPDSEEEEHSGQQLADRFAASALITNLYASVPDDVLTRWMEKDQRFRDTWNRQRPDLADQSGSGYDMALACFGVRSGLNDQQIADLIIHHRRIHGEQQRTRVDYFQRTISKARKSEVPTPPYLGRGPQRHSEAMVVGDAKAGTPDPALKKAMLCDRLSQLLGVRVIRIRRLTGTDPIYLMNLPEGPIEFDIKRLMSYRAVKLALAAKAGRMIPIFKGKQWEEVAQMILDACTPVEGTDDLEMEGYARIQISRYLSEVPFITAVVEAAKEDKVKPVIDGGRIAISATDMQTYLNRATSQSISVKNVASMCAAVGAEAIRHRPNAKVDQSRWALPVEKFDPREYESHLQDGTNAE
jgi:hypothetical protein